MDIYILIEEKNAMKILFSGEVFYPFVGGGSISMYTLFKELAKDHEVYAICSGWNMDKYWEKVLSKITF